MQQQENRCMFDLELYKNNITVPYSDKEYLDDLFLIARLRVLRNPMISADSEQLLRRQLQQLELYLPDESASDFLNRFGLPGGEAAGLYSAYEEVFDDLQSYTDQRRENSAKQGAVPSLDKLMNALSGKSDRGNLREIIVFAALMRLNPGFRKALCQICGEEEPSLISILRVILAYEAPEDTAVYQELKKLSWSLFRIFPQLEKSADLVNAHITADDRLIQIMMGAMELLPHNCFLSGDVSGSASAEKAAELRFCDAKTACLASLIKKADAPIMIYGKTGAGKRLLLNAAALKTGRQYIVAELPELHESEPQRLFAAYDRFTEVKEIILMGAREAALRGQALAVRAGRGYTAADLDTIISWSEQYIAVDLGHLILLSDNDGLTPDDLPVHCILMGNYKQRERLEFWKTYLDADNKTEADEPSETEKEADKTSGAGTETTVDKLTETGTELSKLAETEDPESVCQILAETFPLTPGQIQSAIRQAELYDEEGSPEGLLTQEKLLRAAYAQLDKSQNSRAMRIKSRFGWDDLKLGKSERKLLEDICSAVRNRTKVMEEWNFREKVPYGAGITAIFMGPPGTGKTMAAQVVANALHMELYRIDLSKVIDKYVGETEKNIKSIFEEAARRTCVLFFDEADAIFNKRLEATGANERFANIESSLLLQCIEDYDGVSILATNNIKAIDPAFMRRFRFSVQFEEPDAEHRREIWESVFPAETPVDEDVDFGELADMFNFSGALIKNSAMAAAYLAAEDGGPVTMFHILRAIKRELGKAQRVLTKNDLGMYSNMYYDL